MSEAILGSAKGTICYIVYISLGCVCVPVFASFHGGIEIIIGPTGGYIIGYVAASFIVGLFSKNNRSVTITGLSMMLGLIACYSLGTMWLVISTHTRILDALLICVIPFLIGDILKIVLGVILSQRLRAILKHFITV